MAEFKNSIAQANVNFPIETVVETIPGAAYSRAIIFMHTKLVTANLNIADAAAGNKYELNANNFGDTTAGALKAWLTPFFALAQNAKLAIALYDTDSETPAEEGGGSPVVVPATSPLSETYEKFKYWAYFKFGIAEYGSEDYQTLQVELATLCLADPLYSTLWVGTADTAVLTKSSALISALKGAGADCRVVYNPDSTINAALVQLGDTLAVANATGTPVGNDIDMHGFTGLSASGALNEDGDRENLTPSQKSALDEQKIGYNTWCGDGTENVVTEGSITLKGTVIGAEWVKRYIEYVCKVKGTSYITKRNRFRSNEDYQAILLIVIDEVNKFVAMGRLSDFVLSAPPFSQLPASADAITVPNAWSATYVDRIRTVTVYGTLYVTQPSK